MLFLVVEGLQVGVLCGECGGHPCCTLGHCGCYTLFTTSPASGIKPECTNRFAVLLRSSLIERARVLLPALHWHSCQPVHGDLPRLAVHRLHVLLCVVAQPVAWLGCELHGSELGDDLRG